MNIYGKICNASSPHFFCTTTYEIKKKNEPEYKQQFACNQDPTSQERLSCKSTKLTITTTFNHQMFGKRLSNYNAANHYWQKKCTGLAFMRSVWRSFDQSYSCNYLNSIVQAIPGEDIVHNIGPDDKMQKQSCSSVNPTEEKSCVEQADLQAEISKHLSFNYLYVLFANPQDKPRLLYLLRKTEKRKLGTCIY